jgi:hypothetical protein
MNAVERFAILDLLSCYVHIVDDAKWESLDEVFTSDARCDYSDFAPWMTPLNGLEEIRERFSTMEHPIAHQTFNTLVDATTDEKSCTMRSKLLIVMANRKVYVGEYCDRAIRTDSGWKFSERIALRAAALRRERTSERDETALLSGSAGIGQ